jgi:hypothetical protein
MDNFPDDDPGLTNFLRQHRSIAPPESIELEDRMMSEIESITTTKKRRVSQVWWGRIFSGVGIAATGLLGATIHYVMSPPELSTAEVERLDLYLAHHWRNPVVSPNPIDNSDDLDAFLLQDEDAENL